MPHIEDRPIVSWGELCARWPDAVHSRSAKLNCAEFLKAVEALSGHSVGRRWLQFYSSPRMRLMPLPVYARRHTAHYLHPESTLRLALIVHLRTRYFLPIKLVREILATLPAEHYRLILKDGLSVEEIRLLARPESRGISPQGLIYRRVAKLLALADSCGQAGPRDAEAADERAAATRFQRWIEARPESAAVCESTELGGLLR